MHSPERRRILALLTALALPKPSFAQPDSSLRKAALDAARWIRAHSIRSDAGLAWPADPRDPKSVSNTLYSGNPGVLLFLLELARIQPDKAAQAEIWRATQTLLRGIESEKNAGLYTGLAGIGFALTESYRWSKSSDLHMAGVRTVKRLDELAIRRGHGVEWNDTTDIISGSAGVGLFLLDAALAGTRYLLSIAQTDGNVCLIMHNDKEGKGLHYLSWCHGPAGTARLFYRLHEITGDKSWMDWVHKVCSI